MERFKIIIVEPSEIIRNGLAAVFRSKTIDFQVFTSSVPVEIAEYIRQNPADVYIVNPSVCHDHAGEKLKALRHSASTPNFRLVGLVYAYYDQTALLLFDELIYISDPAELILKKVKKLIAKPNVVPVEEENAALSQRESDVIRLIALGHSNREIADELHISVHTVISHRKNITAKLGIKSASGLTIYAVINKLISSDDFRKTI